MAEDRYTKGWAELAELIDWGLEQNLVSPEEAKMMAAAVHRMMWRIARKAEESKKSPERGPEA